jgi:adenosylcobinamide-GDP ribazoletransferase
VSGPLDGVRLAITTLTVLPVRSGTVDRTSASTAMSLAPAVGATLGAVVAGLADLGLRYGLTPLPLAALLVALLALLTRGLHLDGLADTLDGLASYRESDAALAIMKSPEVGPLGVAAVAGILLLDTAALSVLIGRHDWLAVVIAVALGRSAITWCCRRGVPPARPDGLGVLVAGSVAPAVAALWTVVLLGLSWPATDRHWTGLVAVAVATGAVLLSLEHVRRRLGGVTGDVLGAACELGTGLAMLLLSVR